VRSEVLCGFLRIPLELHAGSVPCPQLRAETGEAKPKSPNPRRRATTLSKFAGGVGDEHLPRDEAVNEFITARRVPAELDRKTGGREAGQRGEAWSLLTASCSALFVMWLFACGQTLTRNAVMRATETILRRGREAHRRHVAFADDGCSCG